MSDDATDEDELLAQVAGGDMRALEALYRRMRVQVCQRNPVAVRFAARPRS